MLFDFLIYELTLVSCLKLNTKVMYYPQVFILKKLYFFKN